MLKIGLSGVQGADKSRLAQDLKTALEKTGKYKKIKIIDDYVQEIEKEVDLAMEFVATYIGNAYVALGRATRERLAAEEGYDAIITCGTIFETASYMAQQLESVYNILVDDDEKAEHIRRTEAGMKFISCLYVDTVKYNYIFHLPRVHKTEDEDFRIQELDKALMVAFDSFTLFPTTRVESVGDTVDEIAKNRVKKVLEVIGENNS
jgi:hypothetical protein